MKATGSVAPIKVLLKKIVDKTISELEAVNIFVSMSSNVVNPAIIKDLVVSSVIS